MKIAIDSKKCEGCGLCASDCVVSGIALRDNKAVFLNSQCLECGHCVAICPADAVHMPSYDKPEALAATRVEPEILMGQMKSRRSMRKFTAQAVPQEIIAQIIEAGRYTPTGSNKQGTSFVVLERNIAEYERLAVEVFRRIQPILGLIPRFKFVKAFKLDDRFFFKGAPVAIVVKSNDIIDGALAASTMELMAQSHGLGVLYSGLFSRAARLSPRLKKKLGVIKGEKIVTTLVLGYPAVQYRRTAPRKKPRIKFE